MTNQIFLNIIIDEIVSLIKNDVSDLSMFYNCLSEESIINSFTTVKKKNSTGQGKIIIFENVNYIYI